MEVQTSGHPWPAMPLYTEYRQIHNTDSTVYSKSLQKYPITYGMHISHIVDIKDTIKAYKQYGWGPVLGSILNLKDG